MWVEDQVGIEPPLCVCIEWGFKTPELGHFACTSSMEMMCRDYAAHSRYGARPLLAQLDRAPGFEPGGWGFKSLGAGQH